MHGARIVVSTLTVALTVVLPANPSWSTEASAATCHGQAATVIGAPGTELEGTEGPDVVVTNGSDYTNTKGGDDLVCMTGGGGGEFDDMQVDAGDGDDVVDSTTVDVGFVTVTLGQGDDRFTGGPEKDAVSASEPSDSPGGATRPAGSDVIWTGGGDDGVGTGGSVGFPDHDEIDLGPGRDNISVNGPIDATQPIRGGTGSDELNLDHGSLRERLVIDNALGVASHDGDPVLTWSSMERFEFGSIGPWKAPSFVGGPDKERIRTLVPLTSVDLGGGNDRIDFELRRDLANRTSYNGGPGEDFLILYAGPGDQAERVDLDLVRGRLLFRSYGRTVRGRIGGFERYRLSSVRLDVRGTAKAEHIEQIGCEGVVDGGRGADRIETNAVADVGCGYRGEDADLVVRGGGGDDMLVGSYMPDVLIGGGGEDTAYGGRGLDRCVAETEVGCER